MPALNARLYGRNQKSCMFSHQPAQELCSPIDPNQARLWMLWLSHPLDHTCRHGQPSSWCSHWFIQLNLTLCRSFVLQEYQTVL